MLFCNTMSAISCFCESTIYFYFFFTIWREGEKGHNAIYPSLVPVLSFWQRVPCVQHLVLLFPTDDTSLKPSAALYPVGSAPSFQSMSVVPSGLVCPVFLNLRGYRKLQKFCF